MRRSTLFLFIPLLSLLISSCASSARVLEPEIEIRQISDDAFLMEQRSARASIEYEIIIRNRSGDPIRFIRLDLQTVGGGPYILRNTPERFNREIASDETVVIPFAMWGVSRGGRAASIEPVVLTGTCHFDSPSGTFSKKFLRRIQQPRGGGRNR